MITEPKNILRPKCFDDDDVEEALANLEQNDDLRDRAGFDVSFLGLETPKPTFMPEIAGDALDVGGSTELRYEHFSVAMSRDRRMARWVGWNIDGSRLLPEGTVKRVSFRHDPRLPLGQQITGDAYKHNRLDQGHVSRRADLIWGPIDEATRANSDSSYFPNITPQMDDFNESMKAGLWGCLENALYKQAKTGQRISVFGGPIFGDNDVQLPNVLVPIEFWKLLVYVVDGRPCAKAFVLKQNVDVEVETIGPAWEPYAKRIDLLSDRTKLDFGVVARWDTTVSTAGVDEVETPISDLDAIDW